MALMNLKAVMKEPVLENKPRGFLKKKKPVTPEAKPSLFKRLTGK